LNKTKKEAEAGIKGEGMKEGKVQKGRLSLV